MRMDQIKEVAALMHEYDLSEFNLESEDMKLSLKRPTSQQPLMQVPAPSQPQPVTPAQSGGQQEDETASADSDEEPADTINSPIVGTFYNSPAPDEATFVNVGDIVDEDTVVCIVEAMKVMNEIKAEKNGRIKRVLVENATPVEYGQPLFELEPV